ncbi:MAG: hypothetical protein ACMXYK_03340 [Candidatus Woesearchaeota archaeon]
MDSPKLEHILRHDGSIHHPLGGGSYVFEENYVNYLANQIQKPNVRISIGAQPNSSPHFGTLVVFNLAYALGKEFLDKTDKTPEIFFEVVDTAPSESRTMGDVKYQISLRDSGVAEANLGQYSELLNHLSDRTGVNFNIRMQSDFNSHTKVGTLLRDITSRKKEFGEILDPKRRILRMRVACPDCGLTDKNGVNNKYENEGVISVCPEHGEHFASFEHDSSKFEYNTPLRNLIRAIVYALDNESKKVPFEWLRVTGSDYAGYYQEQLLYKASSLLNVPAHTLPQIVYAPLITDWSGAKLSKSLYVKKGAYKDIPPYLVNFSEFRETFGLDGVDKMFNEVQRWVQEPFRLFRNYSVYYFMQEVFNE